MEPVNARTRITGDVLAPMSYANIIAVHSKRKKKKYDRGQLFVFLYFIGTANNKKKQQVKKKKNEKRLTLANMHTFEIC